MDLCGRPQGAVTAANRLEEYEFEPGIWQGIVSIFCHLPPVVRVALHERCL